MEIQQDTIAELGRAEESAFASLDTIPKYFVSRGQIISKVHQAIHRLYSSFQCQKYPGIREYPLSLLELDQREYNHVRFILLDLR